MTAIAQPQATPFLVVFGRDKGGKPHASWFDQASADLARKAAVLMEMHAIPIESDALRELAGTLPRGRVFASGKAFTPFINGKLYAQLAELTRDLLGLGSTDTAANTPADGRTDDKTASPAVGLASGDLAGSDASKPEDGTSPPTCPRPTRSEDVGLGSLVLATPGLEEGWWEAEVIGSNGSLLTLRWRDYAEPTFVRRPGDLAFLPVLNT